MWNTVLPQSNNQCKCLADDKLAPHFEKEVHDARCFEIIQVGKGALHLMLDLCQIQDTLQVQ
jgi:hypothetical protein